MARCSGSHVCNCNVHGGRGITVKGSGAWNDPYTIDGEISGHLTVMDTPTVDLTLTGAGSASSPYLLTADATMTLAQLTNVSTAGASFGMVLGFDGSGWSPQAPTTAAPGAVQVQGCMAGDGSVNRPLQLVLDDNSGLRCTSEGLALNAAFFSNDEMHQQVTHADSNQSLGATGSEFRTMPTGPHTYTAPDWAHSMVVDFEVQCMWCSDGPWAGSVGQMNVRYHGADHIGDPVAMFSMRPGSAPRGNTVGYRNISRFADLNGGETVSIFSQMRATSIGGGGTMRAETGNTLMLSIITFSDQP